MATRELDDIGADVASCRLDQTGLTTRSSLHTTEGQLTEGCAVSEHGKVHG